MPFHPLCLNQITGLWWNPVSVTERDEWRVVQGYFAKQQQAGELLPISSITSRLAIFMAVSATTIHESWSILVVRVQMESMRAGRHSLRPCSPFHFNSSIIGGLHQIPKDLTGFRS
jgi:hypothetical protein